MSNACADCSRQISSQGSRCKSCVNRTRWSGDDPRRQKLIERNRLARRGHRPYEDREWLRVRYEDRGLSLRKIAAEAGCGLRTIARWMDQHVIPTRDTSAAIRSLNKRGEASPSWKGGPPPCTSCGMPRTGKTTIDPGRCAKCYHSALNGRNNPNWRGGVTPENVLGRRSSRYLAWRAAVYARDNFTCQRCGDNRGGNLVAHHIVYWSKAPELRYTVSNGLTLCAPCHRKEHALPCRPNRKSPVGSAKLTDEQRAELRRQYASGDVTQRQLALRFRVSEATVSRLVRSH